MVLKSRIQTAVTGLFLLGQWLLPVTIWTGEGFDLEMLLLTTLLWGTCLVAAMLLMAWQTVRAPTGTRERPPAGKPADD